MLKVIVLNRFDRTGECISTTAYKGISVLAKNEELIYHDKPLTVRMMYKRFQDNNKFLKGHNWTMQEVEVKRSLRK